VPRAIRAIGAIQRTQSSADLHEAHRVAHRAPCINTGDRLKLSEAWGAPIVEIIFVDEARSWVMVALSAPRGIISPA
jgi:hypothetical protein